MKKKSNLNRIEQRAHDANAKRLREMGVIPSEKKPTTELHIEQMGGPTESFIDAPPIGGYGIAVWVRIVALRSGIAICDFEITPQGWEDNGIHLVDVRERVPHYIVPGGTEFSKDMVLNDWISAGRRLEKGQVLEGVLIARSFASLPGWCSSGIEAEAELSFIDHFGNHHPLKVDLMVIRNTREIKRERPARFPGLYGPSTSGENISGRSEEPAVGGRSSISLQELGVPRTNGGVHSTNASPSKDFKHIS